MAGDAGRPACTEEPGEERDTGAIRLTVFSLPKPFSRPEIGRIQANAIRSWKALGPEVEVLLLGDEEGIADFARREKVEHLALVPRNREGTPLISGAFAAANRIARGKYLLYCNADVILQGEIASVAERLARRWPTGFLGLGVRRDVSIPDELDWEVPQRVSERLREAAATGRTAARVCKEYFLFPRGRYQELPDFAVGRGNWDNWMVAHTRRNRVPVVDVSRWIEALHQEHGYEHLGFPKRERATRWQCYVTGSEARENERLAGGKWLISGGATDWWLDSSGTVRRKRLSRLNLDFWLDLPRFLALSCRLPFQR